MFYVHLKENVLFQKLLLEYLRKHSKKGGLAFPLQLLDHQFNVKMLRLNGIILPEVTED